MGVCTSINVRRQATSTQASRDSVESRNPGAHEDWDTRARLEHKYPQLSDSRHSVEIDLHTNTLTTSNKLSTKSSTPSIQFRLHTKREPEFPRNVPPSPLLAHVHDIHALEDQKSRLDCLSAVAGAELELAHEWKSKPPEFILHTRFPLQQRIHRVSSESIQIFSDESLSQGRGARRRGYSMWQRYKLKRKFRKRHQSRRRSSTRDSLSSVSNASASERRFSRRFTLSSRRSSTRSVESVAGEEREQLMNDYLSVSLCAAGGSFPDVQDEHEAGGGEPEELALYYQRQRRWRAAAAQLRALREERNSRAANPELPMHDSCESHKKNDDHPSLTATKKKSLAAPTISRSRSTPSHTDLSRYSLSVESGGDSDHDQGVALVAAPNSPPPGEVQRGDQIERDREAFPASTPPFGSPRAGSPAKKRLPESAGPSRSHPLPLRGRDAGIDGRFKRPLPLPLPKPNRSRASSVASLPLPKNSNSQHEHLASSKRLILDSAPSHTLSSNVNDVMRRRNSVPDASSNHQGAKCNEPPTGTGRAIDAGPSSSAASASPSPSRREFKAPNPVPTTTRRRVMRRGQLAHQADLERQHLERKKRHLYDDRVSQSHSRPPRKLSGPSTALTTYSCSSARNSPARKVNQRGQYYSPPVSQNDLAERRQQQRDSSLSFLLRQSSAQNPPSSPRAHAKHAESRESRSRSRSNSLSASSLSMLNASGDSLYFHPRVMPEHVVNVPVPQFSISPERIARAREIQPVRVSAEVTKPKLKLNA